MFKTLVDAKDFRLWRAGHNITSAEAAELLGVSRRTVWTWEAGRILTPRDMAERLANADVILAARSAAGQVPSKTRAMSQRALTAKIKAYRTEAYAKRLADFAAAHKAWDAAWAAAGFPDSMLKDQPIQETPADGIARVNRELMDLFGTTGE
jgi:DNA-binding XRE family transcriptional regulator